MCLNAYEYTLDGSPFRAMKQTWDTSTNATLHNDR